MKARRRAPLSGCLLGSREASGLRCSRAAPHRAVVWVLGADCGRVCSGERCELGDGFGPASAGPLEQAVRGRVIDSMTRIPACALTCAAAMSNPMDMGG